jgi:hypothetical protein
MVRLRLYFLSKKGNETMAKLKRSAHAFYVQGGSSTKWYLVGKDIDDMSVDMNGSFETTKNILGETSVNDTGYEPQISVTPYYADPTDEIYEFLLDLAMNRKSGDDCKGKYLEIIAESAEESAHKAWQEDCKFEIVSYGGDTNGFQIEYNVLTCGNRVEGTATIADKTPTFKASTTL